MKHYRLNIAFLMMAVLAVVLSSCASKDAVTVSKPVKKSFGSPLYRYYYFEGVRQENYGNYDAAFDLFSKAMSIDSLAPEVNYSLSLYYADMGNDSLAGKCLETAVAQNPKEDHYYERLAQWYLQTKDYDKATDVYERLSRTSKNRSEVLGILLKLYQQKNDYKKLLTTIERLEQVDGTSEEITLAKMQIYTIQGDKDAAYQSLKQLVDDHPNDANYKVMMGNWLQMNDRMDEALVMFKAAEADDPNNEFAGESLYDFYHLQGQDSLANIYRDRILYNRNTSVSTRLTLMQQIIRDNEAQGGDSTVVLDIFQRMMDADQEDADIASFAVTYKQLKKMPDSEIEAGLMHVLDIAPDNSSSRLQLISMKWQQQDWQSVIELCRPALEYNPDEMVFCYFLGLSLFQLDREDEALEAFRRGVSQINSTSDPEIVSDFYALMGDILHSRGEVKEAFDAYDKCLEWKADNISCLNNYAYYISLEDDDDALKKAEAMSLKTVNAEPENATYLDTYAWILYMMERYAEAEVYIDRAVEHLDLDENNSTIYEHAGDIHVILGDKAKAVVLWRKALDDGSTNAADIKKKIRENEK